MVIETTTSTKNVKYFRSLIIFLCMSASLSWLIWLWPIDPRERLLFFVFGLELKVPLLLIKLWVGNCVPGVLALIWTALEGKLEFKAILLTLTNWRISLLWYAAAFLLPALSSLVSMDIVLVLFPSHYSVPSVSGFLNTFFVTLPFGPLWEEIAWRAFTLTRLEARFSSLASASIVGAYWAVWHLPLWGITLNLSLNNAIPILVSASINLIAWSIIWAYLYHRASRSLPATILMHATFAAIQYEIALAIPQRHAQFVYIFAALSVFLATFFGRALRRFEDT
jgi:membrane protease YdiL (CAAX protease family)